MFVLALLIVTVGLAVYFLLKPAGSKEAVPQQTEAPDIPFTKQGELLFIGQAASDTLAKIDIEVADNNQKRARGLMYRTSIPEKAGMLFIHDREQIQSFWMKNTYIPLDMLFINSAKEIVTIHPNTSPMKEWNYASTEPALYVVEVNAGFCARYNIKIGDKIYFTYFSSH
jgi:Uncharacterized conserved protein